MANIALYSADRVNELPEVIDETLAPPPNTGSVAAVAFNNRANLLAAGTTNGTILLYDFATDAVAKTLLKTAEHTEQAEITALSFTRSSRRLLSADAAGALVMWDVLHGLPIATTSLGAPVTSAMMHPRKRRCCLVCTAPTEGRRARVCLQLWEGSLPWKELEVRDHGGDAASARREPPIVARFDALGERVLIAVGAGVLQLSSVDSGEILASMEVAGGAPAKSIAWSRNERSFLVNSSDRVIRVFTMAQLLEGGKATGRELQDSVNRTAWSDASFSTDSDHVIASADGGALKMYIWDMHGQLKKILDGGRLVGATSFVCHPTRPILACCLRSGAVCVWTKKYSENWSAFAPDFKELQENEEYEEREDEFDILPPQDKEVEPEEYVDVVTLEPSPLDHVPDADDDDDDLLFLPTVPDPDEERAGAAERRSSASTLEHAPKAKKRMPFGPRHGVQPVTLAEPGPAGRVPDPPSAPQSAAEADGVTPMAS